MRRPGRILLLLLLPVNILIYCQETSYGPGLQTVINNNPSYAGSEGDGTLRFSWFNFYPGRDFGLQSFYASYDSYFPVLHGGAGLWVSNDYLGAVINDLRGGFSYSYHLKASKNLYINGGLGTSFLRRGFSRSAIILPDQIDPLLGPVYYPGETPGLKGKTVFDVSTGFLIISGRYSAGFSIAHLTSPDLSYTGDGSIKLKRKFSADISAAYDLKSDKEVRICPTLYFEFQGAKYLVAAGVSLESESISANVLILNNKAGDLDLQTGISFNFGPLFVFYNYCFNLTSRNYLMPFSLFHNAGAAVRLNNVDKRKTIKTINYPKM
jgi:type IX secretion system PorP/SprF family membrane protein